MRQGTTDNSDGAGAKGADNSAVRGANSHAVQGKSAVRRLQRWLARMGLATLFVLLALWGSALSVCTLGRSSYRWHGFQVELRLLPAKRGLTTLVLRPLGEVQAYTHVAPVALIATLEEIQVDEIKKLVESNPNRDDLAQDFEKTARADLRNFVLRQFVVAALGGLLAPLLFRSRRTRWYISAMLLGMLVVGVLLGNILMTFDNHAFRTPIYTGTLKQAPWVIQFGKDAFTKIEALSQKLQSVAKNLDVLYGRINTPISGVGLDDGPNTFRILHISDIHNNPASMNFVRQVADQFKVKFIVDTGDLTDFGSPAETALAASVGKLPYPYVSVLGNHDSQAVGSALAGQPNVTQLNGQLVTIDGVTLLGLPNPASQRDGVGSVDTSDAQIQAQRDKLLQAVRAQPSIPDIIVVHDPEESRALWGSVPLILCGHEHRYYIETHDATEAALPPSTTPPAFALKTILCNAGTTGAAGGRYLDKDKGVAFSCAVLTFSAPPPPIPNPPSSIPNSLPPIENRKSKIENPQHPILRGIDMIVLNGELNQYSITHYTFNAEAGK